jgi:tRNA-specific 2-thiouridylase
VRILAALSGGVDSSVAAALLVDQGHEVVAATMKLWGGESDTGCCSVSDVEDARRSAAQLGVDHHVFNYTEEFEDLVVGNYLHAHSVGETPNPCIECNRHLKFDVLLRRAELLGFDAVATGHHARIVTTADGTSRIARGADGAKDQSYVLYPLHGAELERVMFPIGHLHKSEVRGIAADLGLRTAAKPDSQDVCFITNARGREEFLAKRIELHPAEVRDADGRVVGSVDAVEMVTIGQRRGLGLAGGGERRFVTDVDLEARVVTVDAPTRLSAPSVSLHTMIWASVPMEGGFSAQVSAHGTAEPARVALGDLEGSTATITWNEPQRRVAPGQSVVIYSGDEVVGGGIAAR